MSSKTDRWVIVLDRYELYSGSDDMSLGESLYGVKEVRLNDKPLQVRAATLVMEADSMVVLRLEVLPRSLEIITEETE